jgi:hypothetical protein
MAKLIYSAITSLDGYVADVSGNFDWAVPDEEVHTFINDLERPVATCLYGRRLYEVMVGWESAHTIADQPPFMQDFAQIWQAADKIVYSKTLEAVDTARTRIERDFDAEAVRQMKALAGRDLIVGGPELATRRKPPLNAVNRHTVVVGLWWTQRARNKKILSDGTAQDEKRRVQDPTYSHPQYLAITLEVPDRGREPILTS